MHTDTRNLAPPRSSSRPIPFGAQPDRPLLDTAPRHVTRTWEVLRYGRLVGVTGDRATAEQYVAAGYTVKEA